MKLATKKNPLIIFPKVTDGAAQSHKEPSLVIKFLMPKDYHTAIEFFLSTIIRHKNGANQVLKLTLHHQKWINLKHTRNFWIVIVDVQ